MQTVPISSAVPKTDSVTLTPKALAYGYFFEIIPYSGKKRSYNRQTGILIFPPKISERGCGISKFDGGNHSLQLVCIGLGSSLVSRHGQSRSASRRVPGRRLQPADRRCRSIQSG